MRPTPQQSNIPKEQWMALYWYQFQLVTQKKNTVGWLYGGTSPSWFTLNEQLCAIISTSLVIYIQINIINNRSTSTYGLVLLPSAHFPTPHYPLISTTDSKSSGKYFFRIGTQQSIRRSSIRLFSIRINNTPYQGPVFDNNDNQINWLVVQMFQVKILLIVTPVIIL